MNLVHLKVFCILCSHIVGLAGPPGAGKTTIASQVAKRVNKLWPQKSCAFDSQVEPPQIAVVLPMDGFHLYRHQLDSMEVLFVAFSIKSFLSALSTKETPIAYQKNVVPLKFLLVPFHGVQNIEYDRIIRNYSMGHTNDPCTLMTYANSYHLQLAKDEI